MKMSKLMPLAALAAASMGAPLSALPQAFPSKSVRVIVPFPPASGLDTMGRLVSIKLADAFGQAVVVENRAGANGMIGSELVARSAPDGYTILTGTSSTHASSPFSIKNLSYDPVKDFTPVTTLYRTTFFLMVNANSPHRTVGELTAALRALGSKASYAYGSPPALAAAEFYKSRAGLQAVGIAYKTAAATLAEMYSGALDFQFIDATFAATQIRSGKMRIGGQSASFLNVNTPEEYDGIK